MKDIYLLFAGMATLMLASCSSEEQSPGGYVAGSTVTLNAFLPNMNVSLPGGGTSVTETINPPEGLITKWSSDDSLDVLVNTNTIVSMTKGDGNTFTAIPADVTVGAGFDAGKTIYGVNNKSNDKITTAVNGNQLKATLDFTGQDGTADNLKKYDLVYGKGDPKGNIMFNHKICLLRLEINSDSLRADSVPCITSVKLKYVATSGAPLFASKVVYNFGEACDSTITSVDSMNLSNPNIRVIDGRTTVFIAVPYWQNLSGTLSVTIVYSNGKTTKSYYLTNPISMTNATILISTLSRPEPCHDD